MDGSEERLISSLNAQAATNDTSLENGQESAISVVSNKTIGSNVGTSNVGITDLRQQDEGYKGRRYLTVGGYGGGTEVENSEEEGHGWGGKKRCRIFQLPVSSVFFLLAALVAVLGMSSFASAISVLAKDSDTSAGAMATTGDSNPLKAASESSWPLLKQVEDMLDSSKASLRALATDETTESSEEMDIAVVERDLIAKTPRYDSAKNAGGVDELQEVSAIMTLLNNHLSDPAFISLLPMELKQMIKSFVHELALADEAIVQIESFVATATADHIPSSLNSNQSAQRHLANEGDDADDGNEGPTNQDRFNNDGNSSSRTRNPQTRDEIRYIMDDLIGHYGHYTRSHWNTGTYQSSTRHGRRTNSNVNDDQCDKPPEIQKLESCQRLAKCGKGYNMYDLFVYLFGDDINFETGELEAELELNIDITEDIELKLKSIQDKSTEILGDSVSRELLLKKGGACDQLLQQFHRFDEEIGESGRWQGGTVVSVCRGRGTTKFLSLESLHAIATAIWKEEKATDLVTNQMITFFKDCASGLGGNGKNPFLNPAQDTFQLPTAMKLSQDVHGQIEFFDFQYAEYCANEDFLGDGWSTCFKKRNLLLLEKTEFTLFRKNQCGHSSGGLFNNEQIPRCTYCQGDCRVTSDCGRYEVGLVCKDPGDEKSTSQCSELNPLYKVCVVDQVYLHIETFDRAIELLFGKMTSIGQICTYADNNRDINDPVPPGFCCLEAPYESVNNWGEMYSCFNDNGEAKVREDCTARGPFTSDFSPAACETLSGTWCPTPRSCGGLNDCIKDLAQKAKVDVKKQAFYQYLDDAPSIEEPTSEKCADLREYFGFDRNYSDDTRICDELTSLQCLDNFSNLDGFAVKGTSNGGNAMVEELVLSTKVVKNTIVGFDGGTATEWRSLNYGLLKILEIIEFAQSVASTASFACEALPAESLVVAAKAACVTGISTIEIVINTAHFAATVALGISERTYSEVVDTQDDLYAGAETNAIYENVLTNHKNIITTFKAVQQLKQMLGEIAEDINELAEDDEDERRRLAAVEICNAESPCVLGVCQCEAHTHPKWGKDPTKDCECKPNFDYVKKQKGAGCDEFDSDGDGKIDICEDRHPPTLLFANAALFKCDEANLAKHCYTEKVFLEYEHAENFLKDQMIVSDDCLISKGLDMVISREGACSETVFTLVPRQNYAECDNIPTSSNEITTPSNSPSETSLVASLNGNPFTQTLPFVNPLLGREKKITVQVDDKDPIVTCGFHDLGDLNVKDKTLFYDSSKGAGLKDANFFYTIEEKCPAGVQVEVTVESNEFQQETMARLVKRKTGNFQQATLYFLATSCDELSKSSPECEQDLSINEKIRFYNVIVTATDSAGRVGRDTCRIIIVPNQDNRNNNDARKLKKKRGGAKKLKKKRRGAKKDGKSGVGRDGDNYVGKGTKKNGKSGKGETKGGKSGKSGNSNRPDDNHDFRDHIGNVADASLQLYEITSLVLLWENNLDSTEQD